MRGGARVVTAERAQLSLELVDLDDWLPADHRARQVWAFVGTLDLGPFYDDIGSREGQAGRSALDPRVLLALWLLGTIDGVGSSRALLRLTESDLAYRWLRGGMPLNYHTLSDFRTQRGEQLDRLLSESLAAFLAEGLVDVEEVIVDGTKVAASAGQSSFKTEKGLARAARLAEERVARLKARIDDEPDAGHRRNAARARAARELAARVKAAKAVHDRLVKERQRRAQSHASDEAGKGEAKASTTDPEARKMRFADGARRAGYNMQLATTSGHGFILDIAATDRRNDTGLAGRALDAVVRRLGTAPCRLLGDVGYSSVADIEGMAARHADTAVYIPPPRERADVTTATLDWRRRKRGRESIRLKAWRERMAGEEGKMTMRRRRGIERVNAQLKSRRFGRLTVRGLPKVQAIACLQALAHNLLTALRLAFRPRSRPRPRANASTRHDRRPCTAQQPILSQAQTRDL
jgi:transposase